MKQSRALVLAAALALTGAAIASANAVPDAGPTGVRVTIGDEPELDACPSLAVVRGLRADGDGFLAVRNGPSTEHAQIDTFHEGREFFVCATSQDGKWFGIVYASAGEPDTDCGIGTPVPSRRDYAGPCRSGWVLSRWVVIVAG